MTSEFLAILLHILRVRIDSEQFRNTNSEELDRSRVDNVPSMGASEPRRIRERRELLMICKSGKRRGID
jgi:hypothetical protein